MEDNTTGSSVTLVPKDKASASINMAPPGPSVLENAGVSDSANITDSNVEKVLEIGGGSWDRDTVIKALVACNNSPHRAIQILSYDKGTETPIPRISKDKPSGSTDAAENINTAPSGPSVLENTAVSDSANISESKVKLVLSVGDGKWDIDAVTTALAAFNNDTANAIVFLSSPSKDSGTSSPNQPKSKKQKIAKSAGIESPTDVPGSAPVSSEPFDASAAALPAISSPATKSKKEKKVKCAKCKKHRQVCQDDCVFRVFTTEKQIDYEQVSNLFGVQSMQRLLSKARPEDRDQVQQSMVWEVDAWVNDPARGPMGFFLDQQAEVRALREQLQQLQQQQQQQLLHD